MEGEKETAEEEEEEEKELRGHTAAVSPVDYQDLPIMHWEDLSQRIAELEKQEQERRERAKRGTGLRTQDGQGGAWTGVWEEEEDLRRCRVAVVTSRRHRNLQLCFINDSDSEDEDEGANRKVPMGTGLKQEVATALRTLRDKLLAEQRKKEEEEEEEERLSCSSCVAQQKHLDRWDLQDRAVQQLSSLRASLEQEVHALSSELVTHLLVRDQLRTKQDAMLLDVQDLT